MLVLSLAANYQLVTGPVTPFCSGFPTSCFCLTSFSLRLSMTFIFLLTGLESNSFCQCWSGYGYLWMLHDATIFVDFLPNTAKLVTVAHLCPVSTLISCILLRIACTCMCTFSNILWILWTGALLEVQIALQLTSIAFVQLPETKTVLPSLFGAAASFQPRHQGQSHKDQNSMETEHASSENASSAPVCPSATKVVAKHLFFISYSVASA